jgi:hypothetical protein
MVYRIYPNSSFDVIGCLQNRALSHFPSVVRSSYTFDNACDNWVAAFRTKDVLRIILIPHKANSSSNLCDVWSPSLTELCKFCRTFIVSVDGGCRHPSCVCDAATTDSLAKLISIGKNRKTRMKS